MKVRSLAPVAGLVAALALGGCSASPGTAAVVDGRTITQEQLDTAVTQVGPLLGAADARAILLGMVIAPPFIEAAERNDVGLSEAETRVTLDEAAANAGEQVYDWSDESVMVVRYAIAAQELSSLEDGTEVIKEVEAEIIESDTRISPRYGRIDAATGTIVPLTQPWIVQAAATGDAEAPVPGE